MEDKIPIGPLQHASMKRHRTRNTHIQSALPEHLGGSSGRFPEVSVESPDPTSGNDTQLPAKIQAKSEHLRVGVLRRPIQLRCDAPRAARIEGYRLPQAKRLQVLGLSRRRRLERRCSHRIISLSVICFDGHTHG